MARNEHASIETVVARTLETSPFSAVVNPAPDIRGYRVHILGPGSYAFDLMLSERLSASGRLEVPYKHRGRKLGRRLVELRETICAQTGIERIVVGQNRNEPFWEHMGYVPISDEDREHYRSLALQDLMNYSDEDAEIGRPVMKRIPHPTTNK